MNLIRRNLAITLASFKKEILQWFSGYPCTITNAVNKALNDYNIYGNSKQQLLPAGYTQLEYIQSSDLTTTYLNTGILFVNCTQAVIELEQINYGNSGVILLSGGGMSPYSGVYVDGAAIASNGLISPNFTINGNTVTFTWNGVASGKESVNIHLYGWTSSSWSAVEKLRSLKLYDLNNRFLFNGIPAKRNSDNKIGMYDTVTNTFFTNAGT